MGDESSANIVAGRVDWLDRHRAAYTESGGTRGHIVDLREIGGHGLTTALLLKTTGRRRGR